MRRRLTAHLWTLLAGLVVCPPAAAQVERGELRRALAEMPALEPKAILQPLVVTSGQYQGAVRMGHEKGIHWYFANIALREWVSEAPQIVKGHLDAYLRNLERSDGARDIVFDLLDEGLTNKKAPDSHDSYASSMVHLAVLYVQKTGDHGWWDRQSTLIHTVWRSNVRSQVKNAGDVGSASLVKSHQEGSKNPETGLPHILDALLMDNCEVYAALAAMTAYLKERGDSRASLYQSDLTRLARGIGALWDSGTQAWRFSDLAVKPTLAWYPDLLAQVFPELFVGEAVRFDNKKQDRFAAAWHYLVKSDPNWFDAPDDKFPHLIVACLAARSQRDVRAALWSVDRWLKANDPMKNPEKLSNVADAAWAWSTIQALKKVAGAEPRQTE